MVRGGRGPFPAAQSTSALLRMSKKSWSKPFTVIVKCFEVLYRMTA